jgi:hypothetical protein
VKDCAVPESFFVSLGSGVLTRSTGDLVAGLAAGLTVGLLSVLTDLLRTGSLAAGLIAGFGAAG